MVTEGPYTYPCTERADVIKFLAAHQSYHPAAQRWNGGFVLAWNIKVPYNFDTSGAAYREDFRFEPRFDAAWDAAVEEDDMLFGEVSADATRRYTDGDWDWKFSINGRSGGWMILTDWSGPTPNARKEIEYQYANRRAWWEGEQVEAEEAAARRLEASRPDMYPQEN